MRSLIAIFMLWFAEAIPAQSQFVSPNGNFEAYTIPANDDGTGMKLFLRRAKSREPGALLRQNNRWIDANWSPDSRFLAVIDHLDGHISDVYVFAVASIDAAPTLLYHTPDLHKYDVKWEVRGWNLTRREVLLDKEIKHEFPGRITHKKIAAHIGTNPLRFDPSEYKPIIVE